MNKHEELRKEFEKEFFHTTDTEDGVEVIYKLGGNNGDENVAEWWLSKIDQIEKVSYKKGYEDGLKQGMFDEEMNKINTQLK